MTKRILLINSDLAKNRGDRAIAEGNILLIKERFPDAIITGISEQPERDEKWYGINFLDMNFQSVNPIDLLKLCRFARSQDIILWGGGEILKDYTNKAALWYWVLKMGIIRLFNNNIYGMYQGIGPTRSAFSRKLIVHTVNRSKLFIVRDEESKDKLLSWGARPEKVTYASDPAVLPSPKQISTELREKLRTDYNIDANFLDNFVCIGPRDWFHYKTSGILPFKYKKKLNGLFGRNISLQPNIKNKTYRKQLNKLVAHITDDLGMNVLLVPMHMEESDVELCKQLKLKSPHPDLIRILDKDTLSASELRDSMSAAKLMIGFRLHSNIIAVSSGVPSLNIYYVDKGRVFFDQIKQSKFAIPIESSLEASFDTKTTSLIQTLLDKHSDQRKAISAQTAQLRNTIRQTFSDAFPFDQDITIQEKRSLLRFRVGRRDFSLIELTDRYVRAMGMALVVELYMRIAPIRRKRRFILYGHALDGNLKAFADYLEKAHPDVEIVSMVDDPITFRNIKKNRQAKIKAISSQTMSGLLTAAHSQVIVTSHGPVSLMRWQSLPRNKRPLFVDVWHGIGYKGRVDEAVRKMAHYDCHFVPSPLVKSFYQETGIQEDRICVTGFARTDLLTQSRTITNVRRKEILKAYGLSPSEKRPLALFAPTWNELADANDIFPFKMKPVDFLREINAVAEKNDCLVLLRPHLNTPITLNASHGSLRVLTPKDYPQIEPLLLVTDTLITDWSSIVSEFSILDKPVLFIDRPPTFAGKIAPLTEDDRPGAKVSSWQEFENEFTAAITNPHDYTKRFSAVHKHTLVRAWGDTLDGKSSQRYMDKINELLSR